MCWCNSGNNASPVSLRTKLMSSDVYRKATWATDSTLVAIETLPGYTRMQGLCLWFTSLTNSQCFHPPAKHTSLEEKRPHRQKRLIRQSMCMLPRDPLANSFRTSPLWRNPRGSATLLDQQSDANHECGTTLDTLNINTSSSIQRASMIPVAQT